MPQGSEWNGYLTPRPMAEALAEGSAASPSCLSSPFYTCASFVPYSLMLLFVSGVFVTSLS